MKSIFTGLLFVVLNFNLNLGNSTIELLPDFIGYIILAGGLLELAGESLLFIKVRPYSIGMAVYTGITFVLNLLGMKGSLGYLDYILGILSLIALFYITYNIVQGIKETERSHGAFLNGERLDSIWRWWAAITAFTYLIFLLPGAAIISIIISAVMAICFLVSINTSKNLYYDMMNGRS